MHFVRGIISSLLIFHILFIVPQNAGAVLRIDASGVNYKGELHHDNNGLSPSSLEARVLVTTHGSYPEGIHNWHGAAASAPSLPALRVLARPRARSAALGGRMRTGRMFNPGWSGAAAAGAAAGG